MAKAGGSSAKGRQHANHKGKYLRQWGRTYKNKEKAWARHMADNPKDTKAKADITVARTKIKAFKAP